MTISVTAAVAGPFAGDGSTKAFPFAFKVMSAAELEVRRTIAGVEAVVPPSAYAVALNAGEGGTVLFTVAPASGTTVAILADPDFAQQTSFTNSGAFLPSVVDQALDRGAMRSLALKRDVDRAIKAPIGEEGPAYPSAADRAERYLAHDADGNIIPGISADDLTNIQTTVEDATEAVSIEATARVAGDAAEAQARASGDAQVLAMIAAAGTPLATVTIPVTSRASLQALSTTIGLRANFDGSSWDLVDYSAVSAYVTADTAQGLFVRSTFDASKVWKRVFFTDVWFHWFGAIQGSNAGANAATNNAAWTAMQTCLASLATNISSNFQGLYEIRIGLGTYEGSTVWELTKGSTILRGCGMGHIGATVITGGTRLLFYGSGGLRTQSSNTSGISTGDVVTHTGADGACIRDLGIQGDFSTTEAEYHALHIRAQTHVQNVGVTNFAGDGIRIEASTAGVKGNASSSTFINCHAWGCRQGLYFTGNNTGSCIVFGGSFNNNRRWNVRAAGSIGSMFYGCESASGGTVAANDGVTIPATNVVYGGQKYFCIVGQESGASTNAPSGTTADNTWWAWRATGASTSGVPDWFSGMLVDSGGCYSGTGGNLFSGCYAENSGQGKFQGQQGDKVDGGKLSLYCWLGGSGSSQTFAVVRGGANNFATTDGAYQAFSGTVEARLGDQNGNTSNRILFGSEPTIAPSGHSLFYNGTGLYFGYAGSITTGAAFRITGPNTTEQFNTGVAAPHVLFVPRLAIPSSVGGLISTARQISRAASVAFAAGATPTKAEFDALITSLRNANLMT